MNFLAGLSMLAALWLMAASEQGLAGAWADWCLAGILLLWTSFIIRMKLWERREKRNVRRWANTERTTKLKSMTV